MQSSSRKKINILYELDMAIKRKVQQRSKDTKGVNQAAVKHPVQLIQKKTPLLGNRNKSHEKQLSYKIKSPTKQLMNLTSYENNEIFKIGHASEKKFHNRKMDKLVGLISYALSSADKVLKHVNFSNFEAEFSVKLFLSDKEALLAELDNLKLEDVEFGTAQKSSSGSNATNTLVIQNHSLRAQNSSFRKQIMLLEAQISKLKAQKIYILKQTKSLKAGEEKEEEKAPSREISNLLKQMEQIQAERKQQRLRQHQLKHHLFLKVKEVEKISNILKELLPPKHIDSLLQNIDKSTKFNMIVFNNSENPKKKVQVETILTSLNEEYKYLVQDIFRMNQKKEEVFIYVEENVVPMLQREGIPLNIKQIDDVDILKILVEVLEKKETKEGEEEKGEEMKRLENQCQRLKEQNLILTKQIKQILDSKNINQIFIKEDKRVSQLNQKLLIAFKHICQVADLKTQTQNTDIDQISRQLELTIEEQKQKIETYAKKIAQLDSQIKKLASVNHQWKLELQSSNLINTQLGQIKQELLKSKQNEKLYLKQIQELKDQSQLEETKYRLSNMQASDKEEQKTKNHEQQEIIHFLKEQAKRKGAIIEQMLFQKEEWQKNKQGLNNQTNSLKSQVDSLRREKECFEEQSNQSNEKIKLLENQISENKRRQQEKTIEQDMKDNPQFIILNQQIVFLTSQLQAANQLLRSSKEESEHRNQEYIKSINQLTVNTQEYQQKLKSLEFQRHQQRQTQTIQQESTIKLRTQISQLKQELKNEKSLKEHEVAKVGKELELHNRKLTDEIDVLKIQIVKLKGYSIDHENQIKQLNLIIDQAKLQASMDNAKLQEMERQRIQWLETVKNDERQLSLIKRQSERRKQVENMCTSQRQQYQRLKKLLQQTQRENTLIKMKMEHTMNLIKIIIKKILNVNDFEDDDADSLLEKATNLVREWKLNLPLEDSATPKRYNQVQIDKDNGDFIDMLDLDLVDKNMKDQGSIKKEEVEQDQRQFKKDDLEESQIKDKLEQLITQQYTQKQLNLEEQEMIVQNRYSSASDYQPQQKIQTEDEQNRLDQDEQYSREDNFITQENVKTQSANHNEIDDIRKSSVLDGSDIISSENKSQQLLKNKSKELAIEFRQSREKERGEESNDFDDFKDGGNSQLDSSNFNIQIQQIQHPDAQMQVLPQSQFKDIEPQSLNSSIRSDLQRHPLEQQKNIESPKVEENLQSQQNFEDFTDQILSNSMISEKYYESSVNKKQSEEKIQEDNMNMSVGDFGNVEPDQMSKSIVQKQQEPHQNEEEDVLQQQQIFQDCLQPTNQSLQKSNNKNHLNDLNDFSEYVQKSLDSSIGPQDICPSKNIQNNSN